MAARAPADQPARDEVAALLDETVFVEAAAGTGKTTALATRVVELVANDVVPMREIAAITFTEKAAGELRDRIRRLLSERAAAPDADIAARCTAALAEVDDSAICTLHAFAQRILASHPLELGMPPRLAVLDDLEARSEFEAAWDEFAGAWLETDDSDLRVALLLGLRTSDLHDLAAALHTHWDRVDDAPFPALANPPIDRESVVAPLVAAITRLAECTDPDDELALHLGDLTALPDQLRSVPGDLDFLKTLAEAPGLKAGRKGRAANWGGADVTSEIRDLLTEAQTAAEEALSDRRAALASRLAEHVRRFVLDHAHDRRRRGRLEFHDLLVLARRLLREHPAARQALRHRWRRLLVDEFQDTDPLQIEIAALLAAPDGEVGDTPWHELPIEEGRLFFVGDPKQSIYRFRRADITLYRTVREAVTATHVELTTNFRSTPAVVEWINHLFDALMTGEPADLQAPHIPLAPHREPATGSVTLVGGPTDDGIGAIREREATDVAATAGRARTEGWVVHDGDATRPARFDDVAVLLPTRRLLPQLETAFAAQSIPYRIESRSLLWSTQEVRDLLAVLRAVEDAADQIALIAALRSPAFGCRDDALREYREAGGRWSHQAALPEILPVEHPVVEAILALRELHRERHWLRPHSLVERVLREGRLFEAQAVHERPRDHWRRLRFVLDQARAFEESGDATLRGFVDWAEEQAEADVAVNESVLPEPDDHAVRVMTVHAAKGLEFPIVILAGLNSTRPYRRPVALFGDDGPEIDLGPSGSRFTSAGYETLLRRERDAEDCEDVRLLYVAATRARDHLVVSLHHKDVSAKRPCTAQRIAARDGLDALTGTPTPAEAPHGDAEAVMPDLGPREGWIEERTRLLEGRVVTPVVAATAVAGDRDDEPHEPDGAAPWRRGRAGTSVGRAVHAVLQTVDLEGGEHLDALATAQAAAEGVPDRADDIRRLARAALDSAAVRAAVDSGRFWREVYVGAPVGGGAVEGYVDLLYEDDDDLVVVDYKTDRVVGDPAELVRERYRLQGAAYAAGLESALGRRVSRCTFVFVGTGHPIEVDVDGLEAAVAEVTERIREKVGPPPGS